MAVIINDFEIVPPSPDSQDSSPSDRAPEQQSGAAQMLKPEDIEHIMRRAVQRKLRLWAD